MPSMGSCVSSKEASRREATKMLQTLLEAGADLRSQWIEFLALEDLTTLSLVSNSVCFREFRQFVVARVVWRLPYPPQWLGIGGVAPTAEAAAFDSNMYERATYLSSMDETMKRSIRKVSVARGVLLDYVARHLPNVTSVRTWQFMGELAGINDMSVTERRGVYQRFLTMDLSGLTGPVAWKELSLSPVHVAGLHRIAALTELESLEIAQSDVIQGSTEFQVLSPLTQLKSLSLKQARFEDFTGLDAFAQLTSLSVAGIRIASLEGIDAAQNLTNLELHNVWVGDAVVPLTGLSRLRHLRVERHGASSPLDVQLNAPDLESCSFRYCWLLHHDYLAQSPKLKNLDLRDTVRASESRIPRLPGLQRLFISSSPAATRAFDWSASPLLEEVRLASWHPASSDNEPTDASFLVSLRQLKTLEIDNLSQFVRIPKQSLTVASFTLHHLETSAFAVRDLIRPNKKLQVLHLYASSSMTLTLQMPPRPEELVELRLFNIFIQNVDVFQYFTRLRRLSVSGMSYKQNFRSLEFLRGLPSLKALTVTRNPDFDDLSSLTSLHNLEYLNLQHTKVKDVSQLAGMTTLQKLDLGNTLVKNVSALGELKHLRCITLVGDADCTIFHDSAAFPMLRSVTHEDNLNCCTMGHEPAAPW